jgi:hypothetical protein
MVGGERQFMGDSLENRGRVNHFHGRWCACGLLLVAKSKTTLIVNLPSSDSERENGLRHQ